MARRAGAGAGKAGGEVDLTELPTVLHVIDLPLLLRTLQVAIVSFERSGL